MPVVNFNQFAYYPALTCTDGEHIAYGHLTQGDRESLLPIFELGHRRNAKSLSESAAMIRDTAEGFPFILDLNKTPAPSAFIPKTPNDNDLQRIKFENDAQQRYNAALLDLLNPSNGFQAWRELVAGFPNTIPSVIYKDAASEGKQILRQASLLSRGDASLAIRVTPESGDAIFPVILQILSIIEADDRLLIVLDCGQGRRRLAENVSFVQSAVARILTETELPNVPLIRFVCMSSSFPSSLAHDGIKTIENLDWDVWRDARESCPLFFGDYGSHHRITSTSTFIPPSWRATVVFPLDECWLAYRHPDARDSDGWIEGAKAILNHKQYDKIVLAWGHTLIKEASKGNLSDCDAARYWHAAKINIHLHRQIHNAAANIAGYGDDP